MEGYFKFNYSDQVMGALIGNAVGDALGVPVEFSKREDLKSNPVLEMQGFGSYLVPAGEYFDGPSPNGLGARVQAYQYFRHYAQAIEMAIFGRIHC